MRCFPDKHNQFQRKKGNFTKGCGYKTCNGTHYNLFHIFIVLFGGFRLFFTVHDHFSTASCLVVETRLFTPLEHF